jgi:predicted ATPase
MIIGLSGAQGGGKSSLLAELQRRGHSVDQFRVSRAVQASLGWDSLERVMDDPHQMMVFQEEVFRQKLKNDSALVSSSDVILTERTFADVYAYAALWVNNFLQQDLLSRQRGTLWLNNFFENCADAQAKTYGAVLLLPLMSHVVFENDPHRAKPEDAQFVYSQIESLKYEMGAPPYFEIKQKSIADRATEVESYLRTISALRGMT